ncbi:MAG: hypothetical protein OEV64_10450 [Desulfobulbaceae bacterium]|nr:hypothetical protein [Desulfobulbaceae bacterium]
MHDVHNAKGEEMPEWLEFLAKLSEELRSLENERSLLLLLEALHWLHGWEKAAAEVYKGKNGAGFRRRIFYSPSP